MSKWKTLETNVITENEQFKVMEAKLECPDGSTIKHEYIDIPDSVLVIPVDLHDGIDRPKYIMVRQVRYPAKTQDLEFLSGKREMGEGIVDTGKRILHSMTGMGTDQIRLLYSMYNNPSYSNGVMHVCLAAVDGMSRDGSSDMYIEEFSANAMAKLVQNMEITCPHTLAAICAFILNSKGAEGYFRSKE